MCELGLLQQNAIDWVAKHCKFNFITVLEPGKCKIKILLRAFLCLADDCNLLCAHQAFNQCIWREGEGGTLISLPLLLRSLNL